LTEAASFISCWNKQSNSPHIAGLEVSRLPRSRYFFEKHLEVFRLITSVHASPFTSFDSQWKRGLKALKNRDPLQTLIQWGLPWLGFGFSPRLAVNLAVDIYFAQHELIPHELTPVVLHAGDYQYLKANGRLGELGGLICLESDWWPRGRESSFLVSDPFEIARLAKNLVEECRFVPESGVCLDTSRAQVMSVPLKDAFGAYGNGSLIRHIHLCAAVPHHPSAHGLPLGIDFQNWPWDEESWSQYQTSQDEIGEFLRKVAALPNQIGVVIEHSFTSNPFSSVVALSDYTLPWLRNLNL